MSNLALDGTASGSISGVQFGLDSGTPADTNDDDINTYYGAVGVFADGYMEVIIDLGSLLQIGSVDLLHYMETGYFGGDPYTGTIDWVISYSSNGVDYTQMGAGQHTPSNDEVIDTTDTATLTTQARYAKVRTDVDYSGSSGAGTITYRIREIRIFAPDYVDVGLRVGSKTIGASIATDEALRISINDTTYGIPFVSDSAVQIYAGGEVKKLATI